MSTIKVDTVQDSAGVYTKQQVVQVVSAEDAITASGTTTLPNDDTIPQNTEGDEYMTLAITPKSTSNILVIEAMLHIGHGTTNDRITVALFQDSTADALSCLTQRNHNNSYTDTCRFIHKMTAGTTSATTFKFRAGGSIGTLYFNRDSAGRKYGGTMISSITITEYQPSS